MSSNQRKEKKLSKRKFRICNTYERYFFLVKYMRDTFLRFVVAKSSFAPLITCDIIHRKIIEYIK